MKVGHVNQAVATVSRIDDVLIDILGSEPAVVVAIACLSRKAMNVA